MLKGSILKMEIPASKHSQPLSFRSTACNIGYDILLASSRVYRSVEGQVTGSRSLSLPLGLAVLTGGILQDFTGVALPPPALEPPLPMEGRLPDAHAHTFSLAISLFYLSSYHFRGPGSVERSGG